MKRAPETAPYLFCRPLGLEQDEDNLMALVMTPEHLELRKRDELLAASLSILSAGRWPTGVSLAAVAVKRWRKPWALKATICRMWWMRRQGWARCLRAGLGGLPRADAGT
jgi:hypothetical protein